jgi:hypothetical protein
MAVAAEVDHINEGGDIYNVRFRRTGKGSGE